MTRSSYARLLAILVLAAATGVVSCSDSVGPPEAGVSGTSQAPVQEAPISALLALPTTTVAQGASIPGSLMVTNRSADTVSITADAGCRPHWAVLLQNSETTTEPIFSTECNKNPLAIAPGTTNLNITITAKFSTCRGDASSSSSTDESPRCEQGGGLPPLPVGEYEAVLFSDSSEFPEPSPVKVQVVAR